MDAIRHIAPLGFPWKTQDPFLFCVHHEDFYPKGNEEMGPAVSLAGRPLGNDFTIKDGFRMYHGTKVPGFPAHPHRGFETVTVVRKGWVDHSDSMGATGRFGQGDVQWMTAGKGVQHSEAFPLVYKDHDNPFELFQIWLNLPARNKMVEPHYKMLWHDEIPIIQKSDDQGRTTEIAVIAGQWHNTNAPAPPPDSWAHDSQNHVGMLTIKIPAGGTYQLPAAAQGVNRSLYYFKGDGLAIAGTAIPGYHSVEVNPEAALPIHNTGEETAELLLLQGVPINEKVVQHGPFVMNTQTEIRQAMYEYQVHQFGGWPWDDPSPVHPRDKGRFAKYADGTVEEKDAALPPPQPVPQT